RVTEVTAGQGAVWIAAWRQTYFKECARRGSFHPIRAAASPIPSSGAVPGSGTPVTGATALIPLVKPAQNSGAWWTNVKEVNVPASSTIPLPSAVSCKSVLGVVTNKVPPPKLPEPLASTVTGVLKLRLAPFRLTMARIGFRTGREKVTVSVTVFPCENEITS